jgi:Bardet-Biedl syndrome 7 protein
MGQLQLQILPREEDRKPQKVALGDLTGVIQCVGVKKGEILTTFKTLPAAQQKVWPLQP